MASQGDELHALLAQVEGDLRHHMAEANPRRYEHSLGVAQTAERLAEAYAADPLEARLAGLLHDWDKVFPSARLVEDARQMGIDLGVDLPLVAPLLHGLTAARRLRERYPQLPSDILDAIACHTIGGTSLTTLAKVVFVADLIEPGRGPIASAEQVRAMVAVGEPLDEVYFRALALGASYVLETGRYLFPGTLETYNTLALRRAKGPSAQKGARP